MERTCEHCGGTFEGKRRDARFCSPAHRVAAGRAQAMATDYDTFAGYMSLPPDVQAAAEGFVARAPVIDPPLPAGATTYTDVIAGEPTVVTTTGRVHPCCKHCRHGAGITGHTEGCRQGC